MTESRTKIDHILNDYEKYVSQNVTIYGWIVTVRWQKNQTFIKLFDSAKSRMTPIQIICNKTIFGDTLNNLSAGCSLKIFGQVVKSPAKGQLFEIVAEKVVVLGIVNNPSAYPLDKGSLSIGTLRSIPHLECHTEYKSIIYTIRHGLMNAMTEYFNNNEFIKVDMPLITFSECEGGCQPMQATLLLTSGKSSDIPLVKNTSNVDFSQDFFGSKASLTVSAQMELETQLPLGNVWTMTRAIRGEPSQTAKHLAEFSMLEFEMGFIDSAVDIMNVSEDLIKYCIVYTLKNYSNELERLQSLHDTIYNVVPSDNKEKHIDLLNKYLTNSFVRITHASAVELINSQDVLPKMKYDEDLSSASEKYIVDYYKMPVIVMKYPKNVKAFYMPVVNETFEESRGVEHVDSFDILVPDLGELVGGSKRIDNAEDLEKRIDELKLDRKPLEFYIELRKNGSIPHGGMGMGFERLVKFITGVYSVKECVAYPRYIGCNETNDLTD